MIVLVALYDVHSFPVRLLHASMERRGEDVMSVYYKNFYTDRHDHSFEKLVGVIASLYPESVGFSVRSSFFPMFKEISTLLRKTLKYPVNITVGGCHPTICPEECKDYADTVVEGSISDLRFDDPDLPLPLYNDRQVYIDSDPNFNSERMSVLTATGCFFNCKFCYSHINRQPVRRKSVDKVMEEVENLQSRFPNLKKIVFSDSVFTWGESWLSEFCKEYPKTGLSFRCFGHFNLITKPMLDELKQAGCEMMTLGIQSGSERIRQGIYGINVTNEDIVKGVRIIADSGIKGRYDCIHGLPYETDADRKEQKELIARMKRPFTIRNFKLIHNPKTSLTKRLMVDGHITEGDVEGKCSSSYREWAEFKHYETN